MPPEPATPPSDIQETGPLYAVVLDEISLAPFLLHTLMGKEVTLVAIRPVLPQMQPVLDRISQWAIARYRVRWTIDYTPELVRDWRWDRNLYFQNVYGRYEAWQDAYYRLPQANGETDDYAYAFNHLTANHVYDKAIEIFAIEALNKATPGRKVIKIGMARDTVDLYTFYFGVPPTHVRTRFAAWDLALNALITPVAALLALSWMVRHLQLRVSPEQVFCIVDRLGNPQEELLIEALETGGKIVSFDRSLGGVTGVRTQWGDGRFDLADFLSGTVELFGRLGRLWWRYGRLSARHFFLAINLPRKAILWRGLLNLYRPQHFIGRDEYNSDHVLRGGELARHGAKSHGISGAVYAAFTDVAPNSRYVAFDHLYVAGTKVVIPDRWRKSMRLHPIGTWGIPSDLLRKPGPPGHDILISVRIAFEEDEMIRITHAVARAFPDKSILLQMKPVTFLTAAELDKLVQIYCGDYPNITLSEAPIYELVERAKYHISDISSLVAESIHRGAYCFVADVLGHQTCCYREFPELCVTDAAAAVSRLERIERGEAIYPRLDYLKRLGLPAGTDPFDVIRTNMGLAPRGSHAAPKGDGFNDDKRRQVTSDS